MSLYKKYPAHQVFLRRALVLLVGIAALPVMLFWKDRSRFYSYLYRVWSKTSDQPVWMAQAEQTASYFY
ncbi:YbfA family protein [Cronobacter sakazakii]|uniref:YbfA family protein n=1 Tax=Cronobacter sakazakii TaxID=28141 RepID=UPI000F5F287A|nr:YbfA family protein [Cronobacter sakazakii]RRA44019.1 DUF2517 domain-containing protein [Cronobacter sakazakii]